jgi:hypothetical protein
MTMHKGRPVSPATADQGAAAAVENLTQMNRHVARGARMRESFEDDSPEIYQKLLAAYRQACEDARNRYEHEVSQSQWVSGRARWATCEHLRGGPAPSHWNPGAWEYLLCTACWKSVDVDLTECGRCGRHDHNLTHLSIVDQHVSVTLHAAVCDDCYPEGADAPTVPA